MSPNSQYESLSRKGFKDFEFELTRLSEFRKLINEISNEKKSQRLCFKELSLEIAFNTSNFALNRLDIDFIEYFINFKPNALLLSSLKAIEIYKLNLTS